MTSEIEHHVWVPEPNLTFNIDGISDTDIHPLRGLSRHGPFSSGIVLDPIRIATITPDGELVSITSFIEELNARHDAIERTDYLPSWPGFKDLFGLRLKLLGGNCGVELQGDLDDELKKATEPHAVLSERLIRAIQRLQIFRNEFDVVLIYLPKRWEEGFGGSAEEDFDLHDHLKATTAPLGIPIQILREDSALAYRCRASVMWRMGIAIYVKSGGIPWKLANSDPETAFIGISYALRPQSSNENRFVTCCSQIFDSGGAGLEFVAYDAHEIELARENPFLSRNEMFRVMARSMDLYRRRHAGKSPSRVMVHKTTEFKPQEIDGCMEAFHLCESVDLIQVVEDVGWRGVKYDKTAGGSSVQPAPFPIERGTLIGISPKEALIWTHGDVRGISGKRSFFKGSRGTPRPIKVVRHAGHGSWDDTALGIMGLTKMNWNNDSLYDNLPVTLAYAKVLARVIKRMPDLKRTPYQFRLFM